MTDSHPAQHTSPRCACVSPPSTNVTACSLPPKLPLVCVCVENRERWLYPDLLCLGGMCYMQSLYNSHVGALVKKTTSSPSMFRFLEPFESEVRS